ncbi:MAG: hypothetical protein J7K26_03125 [Candidatus Aenigmarchaeota archaeon]|nr:hypothetical protein [Candidatus Aenigmarchaeota archaeon]
MVSKYINNAWKAYNKNFLTIIGSYLIAILIIGFLYVLALMPIIGSSVTSGSQIIEKLLIHPGYFIFSASMIIIVIISSILLQAGIIKVFAKSLKGKSSIKLMFSTIKEKFVSILCAQVLVLCIIFSILILIFIPILLNINDILSWILLLIGVIIIIILNILFMFVPHAVVLSNKRAIEAVKFSIRFGLSNFWSIILLMIVAILFSFIAGIIPIIGALLNMILVVPIISISYISLYLEKANKISKRKK